MKKPLHISIPSPCHENWAAMTPAEKGRFCGSCQKVVHDFTRMSDDEINDLLQRNDDICASASVTQLNKPLLIAKRRYHFPIAVSAAILSFLSLGNGNILAQTPVMPEQSIPQINAGIRGKVAVGKSQVTISGVVYDPQKNPFPEVSVIINGAETISITDKNGRFSILADVGDVLVIRNVGYKDKYYTVTRSVLNNQFIMEEEEYEMGQVIYHRSFFGRIFHSVGNWFR